MAWSAALPIEWCAPADSCRLRPIADRVRSCVNACFRCRTLRQRSLQERACSRTARRRSSGEDIADAVRPCEISLRLGHPSPWPSPKGRGDRSVQDETSATAGTDGSLSPWERVGVRGEDAAMGYPEKSAAPTPTGGCRSGLRPRSGRLCTYPTRTDVPRHQRKRRSIERRFQSARQNQAALFFSAFFFASLPCWTKRIIHSPTAVPWCGRARLSMPDWNTGSLKMCLRNSRIAWE